MSALYRSTPRTGPFVEPGTYRAPDGRLVHCRRRTAGDIVIEVEGDWPERAPLAAVTHDLIRLSDDPDWPDLRHSGAIGALRD